MTWLLDNDVFFAAICASHNFHAETRKWLDSEKASGWGIASETYLASIRLFMNPSIMGQNTLSISTAQCVVETELKGPYPGKGSEQTLAERYLSGFLDPKKNYPTTTPSWISGLGSRLCH